MGRTRSVWQTRLPCWSTASITKKATHVGPGPVRPFILEARSAGTALVRDAVRGLARTVEPGVHFDVEECDALEGMVWRQPRGFSFYPLE